MEIEWWISAVYLKSTALALLYFIHAPSVGLSIPLFCHFSTALSLSVLISSPFCHDLVCDLAHLNLSFPNGNLFPHSLWGFPVHHFMQEVKDGFGREIENSAVYSSLWWYTQSKDRKGFPSLSWLVIEWFTYTSVEPCFSFFLCFSTVFHASKISSVCSFEFLLVFHSASTYSKIRMGKLIILNKMLVQQRSKPKTMYWSALCEQRKGRVWYCCFSQWLKTGWLLS